MTAGAGLFATLTGFIASMFLQPESKTTETEVQRLAEEIRILSERIDKLGLQVTNKAEAEVHRS